MFLTDSPNNLAANIALMFVIGFFVGGAANLISAAVAADLGMKLCIVCLSLDNVYQLLLHFSMLGNSLCFQL